MEIRVVRCQAGEGLYQKVVDDVYSHRDDTEYEARFIGAKPEPNNHYVVRCKTFLDVPKDRHTILQQVMTAVRLAYGGNPPIDTPYVFLKVPVNE
jgi:hypothetical protein